MSTDKSNPCSLTIKERFLLTKAGSTKTTFHVVLDLKDSGMVFKPGDSIGVYAENDPVLVSHLLQAIQATGDELITDPRSGHSLSIRTFLTKRANLARLTSSFLKLIHDYDSEHPRKNHLSHLLEKESRPLLLEYLSKRDPLDLFKEYQGVKIPLQEICAQFGPLLPRFYSIASSQHTHPHEVHLTVALFTFTHAGEQRFGVASHFLCHLANVGQTVVPSYIQPCTHFTLPDNSHTPIIMIGPGTGVAPFRAFLQHRLHTQATGKNWLFFGERNRATDYFYEEFWEELRQKNKLRLSLAFSRDCAEKTYVQHLMQQEAGELWKWIQEGAIIYICGDADQMAKDVTATLLQIAQEQGDLDPDAAKLFLKTLKTDKRLLLDVY
jgi:sulfite reductase (NADPH) flavoprotein alpha-component